MTYELIRCKDCHHERVRPREGRFIMDCQACGSNEQELFDLVAVERENARYLPTAEGIAYIDAVGVRP